MKNTICQPLGHILDRRIMVSIFILQLFFNRNPITPDRGSHITTLNVQRVLSPICAQNLLLLPKTLKSSQELFDIYCPCHTLVEPCNCYLDVQPTTAARNIIPYFYFRLIFHKSLSSQKSRPNTSTINIFLEQKQQPKQ